MTTFADGAPDLATLLAGDGSAPVSVCGTYELVSEVGKGGGGPSYYCKKNRLYLYERTAGSWCVGKKSGGKSCKAYDAGGDGGWHVYHSKAWTRVPGIAAAFGNVGEVEAPECAKAVAVECRYGNIAGGYVADEGRLENGRAVYHNAEDAKDLWYGPEGCWLFSDVAGLDENGAYASYFGSAPTASDSPEAADWSGAAVVVHPVDPPTEAEADGKDEGDLDDDLFHDPEFVPGTMILDEANSGKATWIRASNLAGDGGSVALWDGVEPSDIMQGALGDCWLLCALSAVAEFPGFVENALFVTREVSPDGKYSMRLYDAAAGDFVIVTVDDLIPCSSKKWWEKPRPLFSQPHGNEMYILLIEKAFAKLAGTYGKLSGGYPVLAWLTLTGCEDLQMWHRDGDAQAWDESAVSMPQVREHPHDYQALYTRKTGQAHDDPEMFEYLLRCDEANYIMAASISGDEVERARSDGLVERHAYSVIRLAKIGDLRLVQARNPWGNSTEWNGDWCDKSHKWIDFPDVARELEHFGKVADDGLFWMDWVDFKVTFDAVQVCAMSMDAKRGDFGRVERSLATSPRSGDASADVDAQIAVSRAPPALSAAGDADLPPPPPLANPTKKTPPPKLAPQGPPPPDWRPGRLGICYSPSRLAIEYSVDGAMYRKLIPVAPATPEATPDDVLEALEREHSDFLDFENKLSRSQTLRLVEMLLDAAASPGDEDDF